MRCWQQLLSLHTTITVTAWSSTSPYHLHNHDDDKKNKETYKHCCHYQKFWKQTHHHNNSLHPHKRRHSNCLLAEYIRAKSTVIKEKQIKYSQELMYPLCLNWTMNATSLKTISDHRWCVLGRHLGWMNGKVTAKKIVLWSPIVFNEAAFTVQFKHKG